MFKSYNITTIFRQKKLKNQALITFAMVHVNVIAPCDGCFSHACFAKPAPNFKNKEKNIIEKKNYNTFLKLFKEC
jgi:hypothetical protein